MSTVHDFGHPNFPLSAMNNSSTYFFVIYWSMFHYVGVLYFFFPALGPASTCESKSTEWMRSTPAAPPLATKCAPSVHPLPPPPQQLLLLLLLLLLPLSFCVVDDADDEKANFGAA